MDIKGSLIIYYDVVYERELSDKMKTNPLYLDEMVIVFNQDKLISRRIPGNPASTNLYELFDYEKNRKYSCYTYKSGSKRAIYEDFPEPDLSETPQLVEGADTTIMGLNCEKYLIPVRGEQTVAYHTTDLGVDYKDRWNFDGILLQMSEYNAALGRHTFIARKIEPIAVPESMFSISDFELMSKEEFEAESKRRSEQYQSRKNDFESKMVGRKMRPFRMITHDRQKIISKELLGKVLVINFYFAACAPCKMEVPHLNKLMEKYAGEEVVFLSMTFDANYKVEKFLETTEFKYPIVADQRDYMNGLGIVSYPTNMVVDRDGIIRYASIGFKSDIAEVLSYAIDRALELSTSVD